MFYDEVLRILLKNKKRAGRLSMVGKGNNMSLNNKVILVAGGGRDIGASCAIELASQGANVAITYHSSADGANSVVSQITSAGAQAIV